MRKIYNSIREFYLENGYNVAEVEHKEGAYINISFDLINESQEWYITETENLYNIQCGINEGYRKEAVNLTEKQLFKTIIKKVEEVERLKRKVEGIEE